ncbi:hypothetical protein BV898_15215 [Hypsibius exemplaris]|uniref:Uncharacterized protein n=1 Tax=Hypsibius exemplaris TaxID=2072580 RepID=A0A9X6RKH6_HYPEX|nr:hypothetical protein BV898_15215 [Hypsibius exemplaris]
MARFFALFLVCLTVLVVATSTTSATSATSASGDAGVVDVKANSLARRRFVRAVSNVNARLLLKQHHREHEQKTLGEHQKSRKKELHAPSHQPQKGHPTPGKMARTQVMTIKDQHSEQQEQRTMKKRIQPDSAKMHRSPPQEIPSKVSRTAQRWLGTLLNN